MGFISKMAVARSSTWRNSKHISLRINVGLLSVLVLVRDPVWGPISTERDIDGAEEAGGRIIRGERRIGRGIGRGVVREETPRKGRASLGDGGGVRRICERASGVRNGFELDVLVKEGSSVLLEYFLLEDEPLPHFPFVILLTRLWTRDIQT